MNDNKTKYEVISSRESRRYFIADDDFIWVKNISDKLQSFWDCNKCDYKSANVDENDFRKYKLLHQKVLDWEMAIFCYSNINHMLNETSKEMWKNLVNKYTLPFEKIKKDMEQSKTNTASVKINIQKKLFEYVKSNEKIGRNTLLWTIHKQINTNNETPINKSLVSACIKRLMNNRVFDLIKGKLVIGDYPQLHLSLVKKK
jgi:hypothetical protein